MALSLPAQHVLAFLLPRPKARPPSSLANAALLCTRPPAFLSPSTPSPPFCRLWSLAQPYRAVRMVLPESAFGSNAEYKEIISAAAPGLPLSELSWARVDPAVAKDVLQADECHVSCPRAPPCRAASPGARFCH